MELKRRDAMNDVIFIDFDDTLCLHPHRVSTRKYITSSPEYIASHAYKNSVPNKGLVRWLKEKQENDRAKIIVMSSASSYMMAAKKIWIEKHCQELEINDYIGVSVDAGKDDVVYAYFKAYEKSIGHKDDFKMYFIDDCFSERAKMEKAVPEVIVRSPQWIANFNS